MQDTATETTMALCWTVVTHNVPDITVETTGSGSMTQEVSWFMPNSLLPPYP